MRNSILALLVSMTVILTGCATCNVPVSYKNAISPISLGLLKAKTGEERYEILYKAHQEANAKGVLVDYRGIGSIDISIPVGAKPIPLGQNNDFAGIVFNVTNKAQNQFLFTLISKAVSIEVTGHDIDKGDFRKYDKLNYGTMLLSVADENPWVENRSGYSYGHQRKDILLIKNGRAKNKPVMPYDNPQSLPVCRYYVIEKASLTFSNLTFNRMEDCTARTYLCQIIGADNVHIENITINTPTSDLLDDKAINLLDCTNVEFNKVCINGTYSRINHSGYGISLNNIWNYHASNLKAKGNWGVFGNNNINVASITDSEINRFDIHCYGRDITFKRVHFIDLYNQFSSTFGTILFEDCLFSYFTPILYETSYNTYVPHNVIFNNCEYVIDSKHRYLIDAGKLCAQENSRTELVDKCWPNVAVNHMTVITDGQQDSFSVFNVSKEAGFNGLIHSINKIVINGLYFNSPEGQQSISVNLVNKEVSTEQPVNISINRLEATPNSSLNIRFNERTGKNRVTIRRSNINNLEDK